MVAPLAVKVATLPAHTVAVFTLIVIPALAPQETPDGIAPGVIQFDTELFKAKLVKVPLLLLLPDYLY